MNVQLLDATNDAHIWAESFDRELDNIFAVESEIAKTVADKLQAKLTGSEADALAAHPTEDREAHRLYLLGRFFWNKRTAPDFRKAIDAQPGKRKGADDGQRQDEDAREDRTFNAQRS